MQDAQRFLQMRSYCTGHHSIEEIARHSGLSQAEVQHAVQSLTGAEVLYPAEPVEASVTADEARQVLTQACRIWSAELKHTYIGNQFFSPDLSRTALLGWLVEMYHYISDFPEAIAYAASLAEGKLKEVLVNYANQERGHNIFMIQTLENLGVSRQQVENSTPLVSTRLVGFMMRDLFRIEPSSVLAMAALVEAQEFAPDRIQAFKEAVSRNYDIPTTALDPMFKHQEIDVGMGHAELLQDHLGLVNITQRAKLDKLVNGLHDLKHAFDLQGTEIREYYTDLGGKYFPRQPMDSRTI
jgi:pyrroloquinoline quinone (PQQ) biosynthesis protein C